MSCLQMIYYVCISLYFYFVLSDLIILNIYTVLHYIKLRTNDSYLLALYKLRHLTFFFQLRLISWMRTLSSYLIWQIISFILPLNEYGYVYAWTRLESRPAIDLQKMSILTKKKKKKFIFSDEAHFDLKQKLSHLWHRKPARIHWNADAPKWVTVWCGF